MWARPWSGLFSRRRSRSGRRHEAERERLRRVENDRRGRRIGPHMNLAHTLPTTLHVSRLPTGDRRLMSTRVRRRVSVSDPRLRPFLTRRTSGRTFSAPERAASPGRVNVHPCRSQGARAGGAPAAGTAGERLTPVRHRSSRFARNRLGMSCGGPTCVPVGTGVRLHLCSAHDSVRPSVAGCAFYRH